jgi:hypothetical protein
MKYCGGVNAERKRGDGEEEMMMRERDGEMSRQTKQTEV